MTGLIVIAIPILGAMIYALDRGDRAVRGVMALLVVLAVVSGIAMVNGGGSPPLGMSILGETTSLDATASLAVVTASLIALGAVTLAREQSRSMVFVPTLLVGLGGVALVGILGAHAVAMPVALGLVVSALVGASLGDAPTSELYRATRRYLTWGTLAAFALVASSLLDRLYARQPEPGLLGAVAGLFVVGVGILANVIPLSLWLPGLAEEAPLSAGVVAGLLTSSLVPIVAAFLATDPWLLTDASTQRALAAVGGAGGLLGVVLAIGEKRPARVFAYLVTGSGGFFLATLSTSPRSDSAGVEWFLATQALAAGLGFTCLGASDGKLSALLARRPAAAIGLWVATASLIGLPLTMGYVGRALVAPSIAAQHPLFLLIAALTSALGGLAATRSYVSVFQRTAVAREPFLAFDVVAGALSVLLIAGGLLPGPILAFLR